MKTNKNRKPAGKKQPVPCKLHELLFKYLEAKKALDDMPKHRPARPAEKVSYSVPEYQQHAKAMETFRQKAERYNEAVKAADTREKESFAALSRHLPAGEKWFLTEDKAHAVAHIRNDWPGDRGRIIHRINPKIDELPELHFEIVK